MSDDTERGKPFVKVKDAAGNDWLCPLEEANGYDTVRILAPANRLF